MCRAVILVQRIFFLLLIPILRGMDPQIKEFIEAEMVDFGIQFQADRKAFLSRRISATGDLSDSIVSIPRGAVKRKNNPKTPKDANKFQFQEVQLKVIFKSV